jgi:endonuclease/exonuclease/phosphatase family metal-dependent hydrolase
LHFFNVHLGTSFFERRVQATRIVSGDVLGTPDVVFARVLVGDFNEWTRGKVSRTLAKYMCSADLAEHLAWRRTYPGTLPFLHLDHVYHDRSLKLTHMRVHRSAASLVASDHLPLVSTFERADHQTEMLMAHGWTAIHLD